MATPRPASAAEAGEAPLLVLPRIAHEVRGRRGGRLRLRLGWLRTPGLDLAALRTRVEGIEGVREAECLRSAGSLVISYAAPEEQAGRVRQDVLGAVARLRPGEFRRPARAGSGDDGEGEEEAGGALVTAAVVAALVPLLPLALSRALVSASIASTVWRGARALLTRGVTVDVLDAAAVGVPALRGRYGTSATTGLILRLASYLEERASRRSDELVRSLLRMAPETVWLAGEDGAVEVPYDRLRVGDQVAVGAGDLVPVDGVVVRGEGMVNAAAITGESLPVPASPGSHLLSGSVLVDGHVVIAAERVGEATTTARIRRFIERALEERSGLQRMADRMADQRVWLTFGTAAGVYALTRSLGRIETISLVDFSCTTKLGTAVAIKGALYEAGQSGLLLKGGDAIDALAHVDTIVFDKTGTLTTGRLAVTDVLSFAPEEWPRDRLLALCASLAEHTTHPVAASVVELARAEGLGHIGHEEVRHVVGHGLTSRVDGAEVALGSPHFLEDEEHVDFAAHRPALEAMGTAGKTLLYLSLDRRPLGVIALADRLRHEAPEILARLRRLGIAQVVMITGDRRAHAQALARELGLDAVHAEAAPEHKAGIIGEIRNAGHRVAYVGDGVNDGPALMAADVGIAMTNAADIARATAEVVLLNDRLEGIADAVELSQRSLAGLHRTLNLAAFSNTAVLVGAATGRLAPIAAALLHNGTTLAVIGASWFGRTQLLAGRDGRGAEPAGIADPELSRLIDATGESR
jgi:heavy metal translocating P-type ATPase